LRESKISSPTKYYLKKGGLNFSQKFDSLVTLTEKLLAAIHALRDQEVKKISHHKYTLNGELADMLLNILNQASTNERIKIREIFKKYRLQSRSLSSK